MALIAKIDPPLVVADGEIARIHARPYKKATANIGDEIFVWTADQSGGHELCARGTVVSDEISTFPNMTGDGFHKELVLDVLITEAKPLRAMAIDEISERRDRDKATREASTGKLVYRHALNKLTSIESDVADLVRSHFEEN